MRSLSDEQRLLFRNQSIPTLNQLLHAALEHNTSVMFDIKVVDSNSCPGHPYSTQFEQVVADVISKVNFPSSSVSVQQNSSVFNSAAFQVCCAVSE